MVFGVVKAEIDHGFVDLIVSGFRRRVAGMIEVPISGCARLKFGYVDMASGVSMPRQAGVNRASCKSFF